MADEKSKTALAAGVGLTAGALAAFLASGRRAKAAPGGEMTVSLDDPAMQALISILERAEALDMDLDEVLRNLSDMADGLRGLAAALGVVTLENPENITAFRVLTTALTIPVHLPDRVVPYGMELVIKALHTNMGVLLVAPDRTSAININSSYWIIANEAVEYKIRNSNHVWICCHPTLGNVGDGVVCTVEQERR